MVHVQERVAGWLRHGGVGGGAAILERQGGNVRRIVRGRDAVFGGDCQAAASGGDLPDGDGVELSRWMEGSGGRGRKMFQQMVKHVMFDEREGRGHATR